jgi:drug/metabolite transporter (DMT)-like permease
MGWRMRRRRSKRRERSRFETTDYMKKWLETIDLPVLFAFAAVYIIWGTTYLAIKIGLQHMPPFIMASLRYLIAGSLLLGFCTIKGQGIAGKDIVRQLLLGAFMLTLGQGVLFWAEEYISSGLTAVFIATLPVWYILIDRRNRKSYFQSKLTLFSILLGLTGIIILFKGQTGGTGQLHPGMKLIASAMVIGSCLCWATASLYYKYHHTEGALLCDIGWQLVGGTVTCFCVSMVTGEWRGFSFGMVTATTWGAVFYLAIAGSVIAFSASLYLLKVRPPAVVGTYAYVNPIIAVLIGLVAGEVVTASQVGGIVIILLAAYLANRVKLGK